MRKGCKKQIAGAIQFGPEIDITDPCYNRDVWCRMNDVKIVPGDYTCVAFIKDEGEWGNRVATAGIYLNGIMPKVTSMTRIGDIGVDAGLAGFFEKKKDFTNDEWSEFCDLFNDSKGPDVLLKEHGVIHGFCTSSGYGDGGYDVYAATNAKGDIVALELRFL